VAAALEVSRAGGTKGATQIAPGAGEKAREAGTDQVGAIPSPGTGTLKSEGGAGSPTHGRYSDLDAGGEHSKDATLADAKSTARDNKSSEQDVSTRDPALSHASTAGGETGAGKGGETGPRPTPGSGGTTGPGSQSPGAGKGGGRVIDPADDPRRTDYIRRVMAKLRPYCAGHFPRQQRTRGEADS